MVEITDDSSDDVWFHVSGGKIVMGLTRLDTLDGRKDATGITMEFHPDAECSESNGCDGRTAAEWKAMYENAKLALDLVKPASEWRDMYETAVRQRQDLETKAHNDRTAAAETYDQLLKKYEVEVAAHRTNVNLLHAETARANIAESKLRDVSKSFMELHNICKDVVGPKRPPIKAPGFPRPAPKYGEAHPNGGTWPGRGPVVGHKLSGEPILAEPLCPADELYPIGEELPARAQLLKDGEDW